MRVPDSDGPVVRSGGEALAVRTEGHATPGIPEIFEIEELPPGLNLPDFNAIGVGDGKRAASWGRLLMVTSLKSG